MLPVHHVSALHMQMHAVMDLYAATQQSASDQMLSDTRDAPLV
jgi:hypothetical protein